MGANAVIRNSSSAGIVLLSMLACAPAVAQNFYAGKTVDMIVGADVGGGYDVYGRSLARHLPRHIPGAPNIVVKNMPGAGSAVAAANLYNIAAKDGSVIGSLMPGAILDRVLNENAKGNFDPSKFIYLASADSGARVCMTYQSSKTHTLANAMTNKTIVGASAAGGATRDYAFMVAKALGAQFNIISGYKGSADIFLAMERGEVDGMCGLDWNSLKSQKGDWLREGKLRVILQTALDPHPELASMNVPEIWPSVKNETDRRAIQLILSQQVFLRSYLTPPGVPAERVTLLRKAFADTLADKDFLAEAQKLKIDVNPSSGEKVQALIETLYASPPEIVARAKALIAP
jgi:tripartite-type tricarboxylate transporter receptor subunit TctC